MRLVWAQARDGVIGADGALPWHLPEDLRLFRALTLGSTVIMGRRTWSSLPDVARPLPGRRNVVLSTALCDDEAMTVARSVEEALAASDDVWVIGGGGVYAAFLPHATEAVVTEVDVRVAGDTWAPGLHDDWALALRLPGSGWFTSSTGLRFRVSWWRRAAAPAPADSPIPAVLTRWAKSLAASGR